MRTVTGENRIDSLDVLRGIAILMVIVSHHTVAKNKFLSFLNLGHGVDLFFVLSGFLIGMTALLGSGRFKVFVVKRSLRIYPLYFVNLLLIFFSCYGVKAKLAFSSSWYFHTFFSGQHQSNHSSLFSDPLVPLG